MKQTYLNLEIYGPQELLNLKNEAPFLVQCPHYNILESGDLVHTFLSL